MKQLATAKLLAVLAFFVSASVWGQDSEQSPFRSPRPPSQGEAPVEQAPTSLDTFEFNGIMKYAGEVRISVFDTKTKKNFWLTKGEMGEMGLTLQRFDEQSESVVIAQGGVSKRLTLNEVQIEPLKIAPTPPTSDQPATAAVRPPQQPSVESDEEARARIQRVAEEIRRRRAERRQRLEERRQSQTN